MTAYLKPNKVIQEGSLNNESLQHKLDLEIESFQKEIGWFKIIFNKISETNNSEYDDLTRLHDEKVQNMTTQHQKEIDELKTSYQAQIDELNKKRDE